MSPIEKAFQQGYACAIVCIIKSHGADTATSEALECGGLTTVDKLKEAGIDPYDINALLPSIKEIEDKKLRYSKRG